MALQPAVVEAVDLKRAICPHCGFVRYYSLVSEKPVPLGQASPIERKLAQRSEYKATSGDALSLVVTGANWAVDEFKDCLLDMLDSDGRVTQTRKVESNTADTIVVEKKFRRTFQDKTDAFWDPNGLPDFAIQDKDPISEDKVATRLHKKYVFACTRCRKRYTVEKP